MGTYLLMFGDFGEPLAALDGQALTLWRTAAASALAASYLARPMPALAMIGAGALAPRLIAAHAAIRRIGEVTIWNRTPETAARLAERLNRPGLRVRAATKPRSGRRGRRHRLGSDASLRTAHPRRLAETRRPCRSRRRLYAEHARGGRRGGGAGPRLCRHARGRDPRGGRYRPADRGRRPQAKRTSRVTCSTSAPGAAAGRRSDEEITLFKSVGTAIEDLAAAVLVYERLA